MKIINIYIEGHSYRHDLFELIRVFFKESDIRFIDYKDLDKKSQYLLLSRLINTEDREISMTSLYYKGKLVGEFKKEIDRKSVV